MPTFYTVDKESNKYYEIQVCQMKDEETEIYAVVESVDESGNCGTEFVMYMYVVKGVPQMIRIQSESIKSDSVLFQWIPHST